MRTYTTASDALIYEGPGLADFVTTEELDHLIDGTLPPGPIADRYITHLANQTDYTATQPDEDKREDLLHWIRSEIDANIWNRKQEARDAAMFAALQELASYEREYLERKAELIEKARELGATKSAIADTLDISRPTLDKLINEQTLRALFNDAIAYLTKPDTPIGDYHEVIDMWYGDDWTDRYNGLLGVRDIRSQAMAIDDFLTAIEDLPIDLPADRAAQLQVAHESARQVLGDRK